jgi:hypothetical protein
VIARQGASTIVSCPPLQARANATLGRFDAPRSNGKYCGAPRTSYRRPTVSDSARWAGMSPHAGSCANAAMAEGASEIVPTGWLWGSSGSPPWLAPGWLGAAGPPGHPPRRKGGVKRLRSFLIGPRDRLWDGVHSTWQIAILQGSPMTDSTSSCQRSRSWPRRALLFSVAASLALDALPAAAQASPRSQVAGSFCANVSAASVAAIVGHSVPAGLPSTFHVKASKANDGISAVVRSCTYGSPTSLAGIAKDVYLSSEVASRPLTGNDLKNALSEAQKLKFKFTPYSGLGMRAFSYTFTEGSITAEVIAAINGTKIYEAGVYTKALALSKLASLVRLAETI